MTKLPPSKFFKRIFSNLPLKQLKIEDMLSTIFCESPLGVILLCSWHTYDAEVEIKIVIKKKNLVLPEWWWNRDTISNVLDPKSQNYV